MRFQTVKRIPGQDPEQVLGVLEDCFRAVSNNDVIRDGGRITFFGLGPSPRAINRRDTTVIDVKAENGGTTIDADVRFQASAFLGAAQQDVVVHEKLDRIFDSMLTRLGLEAWPASVNGHRPHTAVEPVQPEELSQPVSEVSEKPELKESHNEVAAVEPEAQVEPLPNGASAVESQVATEIEIKTAEDEQPEVPAEAEVAEAAVEEKAPASEPVVTKPVAPEDAKATEAEETVTPATKPAESPFVAKLSEEPVAPRVAKQESAPSSDKKSEPEAAKAVIAMPRPEPRARIKFESLMAESELKAPSPKAQEVPAKDATAKSSIPHRLSKVEEENAKSSSWLRWSAWIAAIVVLVLAPTAWLYLPNHREEEAPQPQTQTIPAAVPQPAPVEPAAAASAPEQPGANEDPSVVISQWQDAMQARDAAAQAAFYADPVDRYFLRHNVSKADVQADKQSSIEKRKGLWTVKMERVVITRPKDATARVSLIKHYMVKEDGSPVSEWFVPSVLLLVRKDGRWQITSERDLGWAASMDELEE